MAVNADNSTDVAFKNCAPFLYMQGRCVDEANNIYIAMPMYNLIEYSDNYSDTLRILWQF